MRAFLFLVLAAFGAFSGCVIFEFGCFGLWREGLRNAAAQQILLELVICGLLAFAECSVTPAAKDAMPGRSWR